MLTTSASCLGACSLAWSSVSDSLLTHSGVFFSLYLLVLIVTWLPMPPIPTTSMTSGWQRKRFKLGLWMDSLGKWVEDQNVLVLHYSPFRGGSERQWWGEILLMGNIMGLSLCVEKEIAQSEDPYRFMDNIECFIWLVRDLEKWAGKSEILEKEVYKWTQESDHKV